MKLKSITRLLILAGALIWIWHCTDAIHPENHPQEWMDVSSENFHGNVFAEKGYDGIETCKVCHGAEYTGGSAKVSCYQCHAGGVSGHPETIEHLTPTSPVFHGLALSENGFSGLDRCRNCHGEEFTGGFSGVSCELCHAGGASGHPSFTDHMDPENDQFHGLAFSQYGYDGIEPCKDCHGVDLDGGSAEVSCSLCHAGGVSGHPDLTAFSSFGDPQFHALEGEWSETIDRCQQCHGDDLEGGYTSVPCTDCHPNEYPIHPVGFSFLAHAEIGSWAEYSSGCTGCHGVDFTGGDVSYGCTDCHDAQGNVGHAVGFTFAQHMELGAWNDVIDQCKSCHGSDLEGGLVEIGCTSCHNPDGSLAGHPDGFQTYGDPNFHGNQGSWADTVDDCRQCHGENLDGGTAGFACTDCHIAGSETHPHGASVYNPSSEDYHGAFLWNSAWDFAPCQSCHGTALDGGFVEFSCNTCHSQQDNVGYCANCHGDRGTGDAYPPLDIMNNDDPALVSVGAHAAHMETDMAVITCDQCHTVPNDYLDDGHLGDDNIAEIEFSLVYDASISDPGYSHESASCENVYCHGHFEFLQENSDETWGYADDSIVGNSLNPIWNETGVAECGSCHGLPPTGHLDTPAGCAVCHASVVDGDNNIIDATKHINGVVNRN